MDSVDYKPNAIANCYKKNEIDEIIHSVKEMIVGYFKDKIPFPMILEEMDRMGVRRREKFLAVLWAMKDSESTLSESDKKMLFPLLVEYGEELKRLELEIGDRSKGCKRLTEHLYKNGRVDAIVMQTAKLIEEEIKLGRSGKNLYDDLPRITGIKQNELYWSMALALKRLDDSVLNEDDLREKKKAIKLDGKILDELEDAIYG